MNMMDVKNISFAYGDSSVLTDINMTIKSGSFTAILGPNGAGKTTLIKVLLGLLAPAMGHVEISGKALSSYTVKEQAKLMGYVPQSLGLAFDFTVTECVMMGRYPHGESVYFENAEDVDVVKQALAQMELYDLRNRRLNELSGGERQRVWLARVLAQEPELIVLDEPTSSLDIHYQLMIYDFLSTIQSAGKTIIMVTHDYNMASQYCDELVLLHQGKLLCHGTVDEVLTESTIREVYAANVTTVCVDGRTFFMPIRKQSAQSEGAKE